LCFRELVETPIDDGCVGLNRVTSGAPALPEAALGLFHFTVGQAAYEAMVEVAAA